MKYIDIKNCFLYKSCMDIAQQKHFAVMDAKNTASFFITAFQGASLGESFINPTAEGITFFRYVAPPDIETEIAYVTTLHNALMPIGGLNGVIMLGGMDDPDLKNSAAMAKTVKTINPDIQTILLSSQRAEFVLKNTEIFPDQSNEWDSILFRENNIGFTATQRDIHFRIEFARQEKRYIEENLPQTTLPASFMDAVICGHTAEEDAFRQHIGIEKPTKDDVDYFLWNTPYIEEYKKKFPIF